MTIRTCSRKGKVHMHPTVRLFLTSSSVDPHLTSGKVLTRFFLLPYLHGINVDDRYSIHVVGERPGEWQAWVYLIHEGRIHLKPDIIVESGVDRCLISPEVLTKVLAGVTPKEDTAYKLFFDNSIANTSTSNGSADFDLNVHESCARALSGNNQDAAVQVHHVDHMHRYAEEAAELPRLDSTHFPEGQREDEQEVGDGEMEPVPSLSVVVLTVFW
ncbi:hypothetical protein XENOCAPTIV_018200 [Xenoophorus captivus]|uniref:Uncharacterized protein n=1 Tax=Xenoophorus captivus TaxID=1517983 RepID=A0ABV0SFX6_9TELE